jgi:hypothetical protein
MPMNIWEQALAKANEEDAQKAAEEEKQRLAEEEEAAKKKKNTKTDDDLPADDDEKGDHRHKRRVSYRRSRSGRSSAVKRKRRDSSSGTDSDIDDATIVKTGKAIAAVKNIGVVYPMLSKRTQTAVRTGVRKMAKGDYDDTLRSNERKSIRHKRDKYRSVYKKGKNPFTRQYAKVGKTYTRFMREVSLKEASSSNSSSSSDSSDSDVSEE